MRPAPPTNSARFAEIPESVRDAGLDFSRQPRQQSGQAGRDPLDMTGGGRGRQFPKNTSRFDQCSDRRERPERK